MDFANKTRTLLALLLALLLGGGMVLATAHAADHHMGVASCAGSTCHGATEPLGEHGIRQDEYFIWQKQDPHTRVFEVLSRPLSQQIGRRLGIDPLQDGGCLSCHSANVPSTLRDAKFQSSDGLGCESCHGGAQRWLPEHTRPGITLAQKQALGMAPLWEPRQRAGLCLSCHQGDSQHPISHAMMAAGHPRLVFELDTFTALSAPHYNRDADYAARKLAHDPARDWAIGQLVAAQKMATGLATGRLGNGLLPELINFDCTTCHHAMDAGRSQAGRVAGQAAGAVPLADSALHAVASWAAVMAPEQAAAYQKQWLALQAATAQGAAATRMAAAALAARIDALLPLARQRQPSAAQARQLLAGLTQLARSSRASDFASAEQAAMASVVFSATLQQRGEPLPPSSKTAVDALYASVKSADGFAPARYQQALEALAATLR